MRKFVIAAAAALTAVSMTGCSGETAVNDSAVQTSAAAVSDTGTEPLIVIEEPDEQPAVITDGGASQTVTQAPENTGEGLVVLTEEGAESTESQAEPEEAAKFSFKASSTKWSEDYSDPTGASVTYRDVDIENAKGTCTVVINYREDKDANVTPLSELANRALTEKGMTDTLEISSQGETTFNGYGAYNVSGRYTMKDVDFDVSLNVFNEDEDVLEVWTMSYAGCTEAMQNNFSEVLSTVNFK